MTGRELIESGIIEAYCMGLATDEEVELVNNFMSFDSAVRAEVLAVTAALTKYGKALAITPSADVKARIMHEIDKAAAQEIAPLLTEASTVDDWLQYLHAKGISEPAHHEGIHMVELPGNERQSTIAAWAHPGDGIPDEVHDHEMEYLFVCKGACEMTVEGKKTRYKSGDLITINKHKVHSALTIGTETMLVIVQRRAA